MGTQLPLPKKVAQPPNFRPMSIVPKRWMDQHALGMEVGHGPGHIVLDGNLFPFPEKWAQPPIFGACLLWPNGWMDQDVTWYKIGLGPGHIVLYGDPAPPPTWGTAPKFVAHVYCGQTVAHLSYC